MSDNSNNNNKNLLIILVLLMIGSVGFNIYQWKNNNTTVIQFTNEVDSLNNVRIEVERELVATEMEMEKYRGIAGNLDTLLNDANSKIAEQEHKIREIIAKEKDAGKLNKKLKNELAELKKLRDEYIEKIDALMAENKQLKEENTNLSGTVTTLTEQKNNLEQKVTTAAQLKAEYVNVKSFKKKSSGKLVEAVLAKRTNKIEACFTVMDNKVATAGDRMVYLRISSPAGKPLMGHTKASFTSASGENVDATASQKVNYTGDKQNLCLAYENDERILESGTYMVEVFIDNTLVHQSSYVLK